MISPLSGAFTERLGNSISSTLSGKTEKTQNYQQNKIFKTRTDPLQMFCSKCYLPVLAKNTRSKKKN